MKNKYDYSNMHEMMNEENTIAKYSPFKRKKETKTKQTMRQALEINNEVKTLPFLSKGEK